MNISKLAGLGKPFSQFKTPKRPKMKKPPVYDDTDTGTPKTLGKVSGKDGRTLVADLIRLRENEAKLVEE